ncbi:ABC-three component system middle component 2 [Anaerostipes butyraticus]|uniref:Threonine transporter n=1 Tax=Anaerostipes butyraticus TaxID=645466 RepID=A0A916VCS7_9FIRM|nr:ABC-three component system middle component 2 [Anaerostipes butyraticus]GFO85045.1 hypothetical protein ANBU17_13920 [Anaerostipes butyraticus]
MKIYNTNAEIGCRILLLLGSVKGPCSVERLSYYDYFSLHLNDLIDGCEGLHPSNPNHSSEIIIKRKTIKNAITYLISKGLLTVVYSASGFKYKNTNLADRLIELLDNTYSLKYKKCVIEVDKFFRDMQDDDITKYVRNNIGKWVGQFESERD